MRTHVIAFSVLSLAALMLVQLGNWMPTVLMLSSVALLMGAARKLTKDDTVSWRYRLLPYGLYLIGAGIILASYDGNGWLRIFALACLFGSAFVIQQTGSRPTDQFRLDEVLRTMLAISCPALVLWYTQVAGHVGSDFWLSAVSLLVLATFFGVVFAPRTFIRIPVRTSVNVVA